MSILITGMEPPKPDEVIRIYNNGEARKCPLIEQKVIEVSVAIPVPPHGDLIDRDEMFTEFVVEGQKSTRYKIGERWELNGEEIRRVIARLPAVIPAEEGE